MTNTDITQDQASLKAGSSMGQQPFQQGTAHVLHQADHGILLREILRTILKTKTMTGQQDYMLLGAISCLQLFNTFNTNPFVQFPFTGKQ